MSQYVKNSEIYPKVSIFYLFIFLISGDFFISFNLLKICGAQAGRDSFIYNYKVAFWLYVCMYYKKSQRNLYLT